MVMQNCAPSTQDRRRTFWATQPSACGVVEGACGEDCGRPGLRLGCDSNGGASISTDNYVIGLALNILLTDARRPDSECGFSPGNRGGFWGDSFRTDRLGSGSKLRQVEARASIRETMALMKAYATDDLRKLVTYGVAKDVTVDLTYKGSNTMDMVINITGQSGAVSRVGLIGNRISNSWVWSN